MRVRDVELGPTPRLIHGVPVELRRLARISLESLADLGWVEAFVDLRPGR